MNKKPLWVYIIGVTVVIAIVNGISWFIYATAEATGISIFSAGFLVGMLAMYIAVHLYKWE